MRDYSNISVLEASGKEIISDFVDAIENVTKELSVRRLECIINSVGLERSLNILQALSAFTAIQDCKTSADQ